MLIDIDKKYPGLRNSLTKPFLKDINPNAVTYGAFILAIISGYFFYKDQLIIASSVLAVSLYLDVLDGAIAKKFGASKLGDFLDHTFDRLSDSAIFIGIALNPKYNPAMVLITLVAVLMVSYLGTQAHALTKERFYGGMLGRADRMLIVILAGLLSYFYSDLLLYGVYIIFILSIITMLQRYYSTYKILNRQSFKSKKE